MREWRIAALAGVLWAAVGSAAGARAEPAPAEPRVAATPGLPAEPTVPPGRAAEPVALPVTGVDAGGTTEVVVTGEKPASEAASRVSYGARELALRPRLRPGDVLEAVPGLFAVQHAGGGKANQYFLRGFDADHGTDVAFFVDGVPVNLVSHGHGQGYADFHFLIPELVVSLDGYKGPYDARFGNFATAGAVNLRLAETFDESYGQYSVGQYGIMRGLVVASPRLGDDWRTVLAVEAYEDDGPFMNPERLRRVNVFGRATHDIGDGKISATWMSYGSTWHGSGQIPARAVCGEGEAGAPPPSTYGMPCIDHFGVVDPTEGGNSQRHMASLAYGSSTGATEVDAKAYFIAYRFQLFSNFTFFKDDPIHGDQIEQGDERVVAGGDVRFRRHFHLGDARLVTSFGVQARSDGIDNALFHDVERERLNARVLAHVTEIDTAAYVDADARLYPWLRLVAGLRAEHIDVSVADQMAHRVGGGASESAAGMLLLPKAMAVLSPAPGLDLFLDYGRGFHSNDARGAVAAEGAATLMTPANGYEMGVRVRPGEGLLLSAAAFVLDLDSELVWSGDEGTTSPSGRTRRLGAEIGGRYRVASWLFADVDATFTRARFRENGGNGGAVALAPTRTLTAGIGVRRSFGAYTPFAAVRGKSIADRPAIEDRSLTAQGFTVFDANAGLRWKGVELAVDLQNVLNATWREVQFANESRLAQEPQVMTGIYYSPGWPRTVIGRLTLYVP